MITLFTLKLLFVNICFLAIILLLTNYKLEKLLDNVLNEWKESTKILNELRKEEVQKILQEIKNVVEEDDIISNHNNKIKELINYLLELYKKEPSEGDKKSDDSI